MLNYIWVMVEVVGGFVLIIDKEVKIWFKEFIFVQDEWIELGLNEIVVKKCFIIVELDLLKKLSFDKFLFVVVELKEVGIDVLIFVDNFLVILWISNVVCGVFVK